MKLLQIIEQINFNTFEGMVRIIHDGGENSNLPDLLRALPGVTTVTNAGSSSELSAMTFKVKLITQKNAEEAFEAFKNNAMNKYTNITSIEIAKETITQK
jgi:predicted amidohydrolase|tara:strand:+ start:651 stop:950 length:300 start_codon:yes stop_codon:yes gene_type:complete